MTLPKRRVRLNHRYISLKTGRFGFDFREALPYADQCAAAVLTTGKDATTCHRDRDSARLRQPLPTRAPSTPSMAGGRGFKFPPFSCPRMLLLVSPASESAGSPLRFSRAPWFTPSRLREVRGFEPSTLLREMYLLTTSPSGRARPLKAPFCLVVRAPQVP